MIGTEIEKKEHDVADDNRHAVCQSTYSNPGKIAKHEEKKSVALLVAYEVSRYQGTDSGNPVDVEEGHS